MKVSRKAAGIVVLSMALLCGLAMTVSAQEVEESPKNLLFASINKTGFGEDIPGALRIMVEGHLRGGELSVQERKALYDRPSMALTTYSYSDAVRLAQQNDRLATVWADELILPDGIVIKPRLAIRARTGKEELKRHDYWRVKTREGSISLGPPKLSVAFAPRVMSVFSDVEIPVSVELCFMQNATCEEDRRFRIANQVAGKAGPSTTINLEYNRVLPVWDVISSGVIPYAAVFSHYSQGNFEQVVSLVGAADESARFGTATKIDLLLYAAAALARLRKFGQSKEIIAEAIALNPTARRTLRYKVMVELAEAGEVTEASNLAFDKLIEMYGESGEFEREYFVERRRGAQ